MKLYKFYKSNCPPCYSVSRILKQISIPESIEIIGVDAENAENKELVNKYNISQVPVLLFDENKKLVGIQPRNIIENFINSEVAN